MRNEPQSSAQESLEPEVLEIDHPFAPGTVAATPSFELTADRSSLTAHHAPLQKRFPERPMAHVYPSTTLFATCLRK